MLLFRDPNINRVLLYSVGYEKQAKINHEGVPQNIMQSEIDERCAQWRNSTGLVENCPCGDALMSGVEVRAYNPVHKTFNLTGQNEASLK